MKKMGIFLGVIVILFGAIFFLNRSNVNELYDKPVSELNPATRDILDDPNYQNIILPDELDQQVADGESMFVYFFASDCPHCKATTPVLMPLADTLGVEVEQFNLREFTSYFDKYGIEYTPTLAYFENGQEVDRMVGGVSSTASGYSEDDFTAFFNKYTPS
ncbi:thioredoxin family protein [Paenibacillus sp. IB182496]|uniref:Thioredoxin family protein n=1 Tax=Paenibacillus sabuli TaxID=2772509 RepID=A0A927BUE1_9BACL|nr:thioredoxin family protein [Paenibacillus sabuli]MBD2846066.1 thioredoxin family protein [Paenibacillus sabuli]